MGAVRSVDPLEHPLVRPHVVAPGARMVLLVDLLLHPQLQGLLHQHPVDVVQVGAVLGRSQPRRELVVVEIDRPATGEEQRLHFALGGQLRNLVQQPLRQSQPVEGLARDQVVVAATVASLVRRPPPADRVEQRFEPVLPRPYVLPEAGDHVVAGEIVLARIVIALDDFRIRGVDAARHTNRMIAKPCLGNPGSATAAGKLARWARSSGTKRCGALCAASLQWRSLRTPSSSPVPPARDAPSSPSSWPASSTARPPTSTTAPATSAAPAASSRSATTPMSSTSNPATASAGAGAATSPTPAPATSASARCAASSSPSPATPSRAASASSSSSPPTAWASRPPTPC